VFPVTVAPDAIVRLLNVRVPELEIDEPVFIVAVTEAPEKVPEVIVRAPPTSKLTPALKVPVPLIVRFLKAFAPVIATEDRAVIPEPEVYCTVPVPAVNVPVAVSGVPEPESVSMFEPRESTPLLFIVRLTTVWLPVSVTVCPFAIVTLSDVAG
jgi:hypothetical protein